MGNEQDLSPEQALAKALIEHAEAMKQLPTLAPRIENLGNSTSGVHFHGSAGLTIVAIVAIMFTLSVLGATAAWRAADMRQISDLKERAAEDRLVMNSLQEQLRTDRLLIGQLKDRVTKVEVE